VIATALPFLREIQQLGVKTFVDCTPAFLGRDPEILACLSKKTGLVILTNTGFYKEPYLPKYTWEVSEERLAEMWAGEILEGIEGTGIKAGFIKIAVNPGPLIPIQKKIVIAACRTHRMTGAAIASHSVSGIAALEQLDILEKEKVDPSAFIFVHAQGEKDMSLHREAARRGAWIEYDGIRDETAREHLDFLIRMLDMGFERQLLISQDSGWYNVGEKDMGANFFWGWLPGAYFVTPTEGKNEWEGVAQDKYIEVGNVGWVWLAPQSQGKPGLLWASDCKFTQSRFNSMIIHSPSATLKTGEFVEARFAIGMAASPGEAEGTYKYLLQKGLVPQPAAEQ